ncbi:MAG: nitrilase-related carbon-nitrogen hydrolase, partial [Methanomethylophilus sp.]|nr:nitrilase-related carbon-nitrogen hydrolase [Methanomethylophilus sp.]
MDSLRLAMACINSRLGDIDRNADTMISCMEKAAESDADLICFPEMCLTGYSMPRSFEYCLGE